MIKQRYSYRDEALRAMLIITRPESQGVLTNRLESRRYPLRRLLEAGLEDVLRFQRVLRAGRETIERMRGVVELVEMVSRRR